MTPTPCGCRHAHHTGAPCLGARLGPARLTATIWGVVEICGPCRGASHGKPDPASAGRKQAPGVPERVDTRFTSLVRSAPARRPPCTHCGCPAWATLELGAGPLCPACYEELLGCGEVDQLLARLEPLRRWRGTIATRVALEVVKTTVHRCTVCDFWSYVYHEVTLHVGSTHDARSPRRGQQQPGATPRAASAPVPRLSLEELL